MAAKKKATAKPTRTGAETKSYTSASSRMQAKGKSGQRSASAAHAGKGNVKPYSQVSRATEDLWRLSGGRARKANKVVDPKADIEFTNPYTGKVVARYARHDSVKGRPFSSQDAEDARLAGKRPGVFPSSPGGEWRRGQARQRFLQLNPQERRPYRWQGYSGNAAGRPYMGPHRQIDFPRWESPSEQNEGRRMSAMSSNINPSKNKKGKGRK